MKSSQCQRLETLLRSDSVLIGVLILTEVLQGFARDREFEPFGTHLGLQVVT